MSLGVDWVDVDGQTTSPAPIAGAVRVYYDTTVGRLRAVFPGGLIINLDDTEGEFDVDKIGVQRSTCMVMVQRSTGNIGRIR